VIDYTDIPALEHFVLEESYFTRVVEAPGQVLLEGDLVFAKSHPELRPPRDGEWAYFREGAIRFHAVTAFEWTNRTEPGIEPDGTTSWDGIDHFQQDGPVFIIDGDFGAMRLVAEAVDCILTGPV
jgi:hypothetical protein